MQRAEGEVASFRNTQRQTQSFPGRAFRPISTTSGSSRSAARKASVKALRIRVQFALVHQAVLVHVHEFDRVFNGENVFVALGIDLVDQSPPASSIFPNRLDL